MADLCVCGHEERLHSARHEPCCCAERCYCERYTRSPLSAFRGPSVRFTREEAAGWLLAMQFDFAAWDMPYMTDDERHRDARWFAARARSYVRASGPMSNDAAAHYLAARILRAVRA